MTPGQWRNNSQIGQTLVYLGWSVWLWAEMFLIEILKVEAWEPVFLLFPVLDVKGAARQEHHLRPSVGGKGGSPREVAGPA